jgi:hypothetical protein
MNVNKYMDYIVTQKCYENELFAEKAKLEIELLIARREINNIERNASKSEISHESTFDFEKAGGTRQGYLQKNEVAERLNKSTRWVEIQCKAGVIPYIKIKRSVLFDWDEVVNSLSNYSRGGVVRRY